MKTNNNLQALLLKLRGEVFKPKPKMTLKEWSEQNRILPSYSAIPGKFKVDTVQPWVEVYNAISSGTARNITVVSPTQVGKSELLNNIIGFYTHQQPSSMALLMPNEKLLEAMDIRIQAMFQESNSLKHINISGDKFSKQFPGGQLFLLSARSPSDLSSKPIRIALADEVSRFPISSGGEGDPLSLLTERQSTYHDALNIAVSTPTNKGACRISQRFDEGTQEEWNAKCVHCGEYEELKWSQVHIDEMNVNNSCYVCSKCSASWSEYERLASVKAGKFIAKHPEKTHHRSFHFNQLVSPFQTVAQLAEKYLLSKKSIEAEKTFINTSLAECYTPKLDAADWERQYERRQSYSIGVIPNEDIRLLTMGVDVQGNRIEAHVIGFDKYKRAYSIEYLTFHGETHTAQPWDELRNAIDKRYKIEGTSRTLGIHLTLIDSGFNTSHVYNFVQGFHPNKVRAIKGRDNLRSWYKLGSDLPNNKHYMHRLYTVGSSFIKEHVYSSLKLSFAEGILENSIIFPEYESTFFKGICSEALQVNKGKSEWVKTYERNEPLDTLVYCFSAFAMLSGFSYSEAQWEQLAQAQDLQHDNNNIQKVPVVPKNQQQQQYRNSASSGLWKNSTLKR